MASKNLHWFDDVREVAAKMEELGATVLFAAKEDFWRDLRARVRDPLGNLQDIAQKVE